MMKKFKLTDTQAEAILNMRLRSLRKLEEIEIRNEHKALSEEQKELKALLGSEKQRWTAVAQEIRDLREMFQKNPELGSRRTDFADAPTGDLAPLESLIEKEPITVVSSAKGWIRTLKGHVENGSDVKYKDGDKGRFWLHAQTTDKVLVFATNGRFYTIGCDKLPGGRGHGEPLRLMIDLGNDQDIVAMFVYQGDRKFLVAATDGRGFVVPEEAVSAQTKNGKQVLNVSGDLEAVSCSVVAGDHVATIGENHKLNIFALSELPEMNRGRGVVLQKFKDGGLSDAKTFTLADGLSWKQTGGRNRTEHDLKMWLGKRANAGRLAPKGFPRNDKFG
jgi:topoisomerase-4 subunit A